MINMIIVAAIVMAIAEVETVDKLNKPPISNLDLHEQIQGIKKLIEPTDDSYLPYDPWMVKCYGPQEKSKTSEKRVWPWNQKTSLKAITNDIEVNLDVLLGKIKFKHPHMKLSEYEQFANKKADEFRKLRERSMELPFSKMSANIFECCQILHRNVRVYKTYMDNIKMESAEVQTHKRMNT